MVQNQVLEATGMQGTWNSAGHMMDQGFNNMRW